MIITTLLLLLELVYFKIADRFNIIDKPNERSSHKTLTLRGGGVIFGGAWLYAAFYGFCYPWFQVLAYVLFMKKYYHLHEEYLNSLKK